MNAVKSIWPDDLLIILTLLQMKAIENLPE